MEYHYHNHATGVPILSTRSWSSPSGSFCHKLLNVQRETRLDPRPSPPTVLHGYYALAKTKLTNTVPPGITEAMLSHRFPLWPSSLAVATKWEGGKPCRIGHELWTRSTLTAQDHHDYVATNPPWKGPRGSALQDSREARAYRVRNSARQ